MTQHPLIPRNQPATAQHDPKDLFIAGMREAAVGFDPEAFISELVSVSLQAADESRKGYEALAAAEGHACEGIVEMTVAPTGEVRSLTLTDEPSAKPAAQIAADLMRAYRRAAAQANSALAASVDPAVAAAIRDSVPEGVAAERTAAEIPEPAPQPDADGHLPPPAAPTISDLPPDPDFERILEILDDTDLASMIERLQAAGAPRVDLNRPAEVIDAEIRAEIQAISDRAESLGPEIQALRAEAENADGRVEVDAWGGLTAVELSLSIRTRTAQQVQESVLRLIADATTRASKAATNLLRGSGLADADDPILATLSHDMKENR